MANPSEYVQTVNTELYFLMVQSQMPIIPLGREELYILLSSQKPPHIRVISTLPIIWMGKEGLKGNKSWHHHLVQTQRVGEFSSPMVWSKALFWEGFLAFCAHPPLRPTAHPILPLSPLSHLC